MRPSLQLLLLPVIYDTLNETGLNLPTQPYEVMII